jgi:hypothetical protein
MTLLEVPMLRRWQDCLGFSDEEAAQHVALEVSEYRRQRATRPSRQTALLAVLVTVYKPNLTKIRQALADLARLPSLPSEDPAGDLGS